jgi:hypothetical protein
VASEEMWFCPICGWLKGSPWFTSKPCGDATKWELHPIGTGAELVRLRAMGERLRDDALVVEWSWASKDGWRETTVDRYRRAVLGEEG